MMAPTGMRLDRPAQGLMAPVPAKPVKNAGAPASDQQIWAIWQIEMCCDRLRQQSGLIESSTQEARPMQWNRCDRHILAQNWPCRARHPLRRGTNNIMPVPVLERQNQLATVVTIKNRSAPFAPGAGDGQAVVTEFGLPRTLAR